MKQDQLIEKTSVNRIRERLLLDPDSLTAVDRQLSTPAPFKWKRPCWKLTYYNRHWQVERPPKFNTSRGNESKHPLQTAKPSSEHNGRSSTKRCVNCGSGSHNTHDKFCCARGVQCRSCGKLNHFAKWCRSKQAVVKQVSQDPKKDIKETATVFSLRSESNEPGFKSCKVKIQEQ